MPKFVRKRAEVEAHQFVPGEATPEVCTLTYRGCIAESHVHTAAGPMCIDAGDWIVTGGGRVWVVEADKFSDLYEPVTA